MHFLHINFGCLDIQNRQRMSSSRAYNEKCHVFQNKIIFDPNHLETELNIYLRFYEADLNVVYRVTPC